MVAGSNNGSGGVYNESVSYSGAYNGVVVRRTGGAIKIGPGATDEINNNKIVDNQNLNKTGSRIWKSNSKTEQKKYPILPGQTKPIESNGFENK